MPDDLRKYLGKSLVETKRETDNARRAALEAYAEHDREKTERNWGDRFTKYREAVANGWKPRERRFWVIIDPASPVSSPEKLQELAGMATLPRVIDTVYTSWVGNGEIDDSVPLENGEPKKIQAGNLSVDEYREICAKTEYTPLMMIKENADKCKGATLVTSILDVRQEPEPWKEDSPPWDLRRE